MDIAETKSPEWRKETGLEPRGPKVPERCPRCGGYGTVERTYDDETFFEEPCPVCS